MRIVRRGVDITRTIMETLLGLYRVMHYSKKYDFSRIKTKQRIYILGNGPSIEKQLQDDINYFRIPDILCVNSFANTDWYITLKPRFYVILDSAYFLELEQQSRLDTFCKTEVALPITNLANKTTWDLLMFVPRHVQGTTAIRMLEQNHHITLQYMNEVS